MIVFFFSWQTDKRTGKPKVWIYKDKNTGRPKGEATITYDDCETAKAAINWFNGMKFELTIVQWNKEINLNFSFSL